MCHIVIVWCISFNLSKRSDQLSSLGSAPLSAIKNYSNNALWFCFLEPLQVQAGCGKDNGGHERHQAIHGFFDYTGAPGRAGYRIVRAYRQLERGPSRREALA